MNGEICVRGLIPLFEQLSSSFLNGSSLLSEVLDRSDKFEFGALPLILSNQLISISINAILGESYNPRIMDLTLWDPSLEFDRICIRNS